MRFVSAVSLAALLAVAAPAFADDYVMMKVNNVDVSSTEIQHMWEGLFPAGQAPAFDSIKPEMRDRVLRAALAEKVLYTEALKQGADKSEKFQRDLEDVKKKLIVRSFLDSKTGDSISDADLKKEYDTLVSAMKDEKQVHARHILVASEEEAKDVKKKLDAGKKFEDLAREYSKDPGSAKQGGDLGTFTLPLASSSINETDTIVRVQDGSIVAIGGLMSQEQNNNRYGLPGISDVPGVGLLFGQRAGSSKKRELVILMRSTVINGENSWRDATGDVQERLQGLDPRQRRRLEWQ